jgi:predicted RNA-binding protein YlqC (UPF0109 family)
MDYQDNPDNMQELVAEIARALVDAPAAVLVEAVTREENTVLRLRVAPEDVGKVIGKQGRTARSMRTILGAVSMKMHRRYTLDILEEERPSPGMALMAGSSASSASAN